VPSAGKTTTAHLPKFCCCLATSHDGMWFLFILSAGWPELKYNSLQVRRRLGYGGMGIVWQPTDGGALFPASSSLARLVQTAEIAQHEFLTILSN
jgi:hypothetical protein